jgi:hypothetical protein
MKMLAKKARNQKKKPISRIIIKKADEWEFALDIPSRAGVREVRQRLEPFLRNRDTIMEWIRENSARRENDPAPVPAPPIAEDLPWTTPELFNADFPLDPRDETSGVFGWDDFYC